MKKTRKKGFTIVELVIVIAVIAILAAVLIPTFSGVIKAANESKYLQQARAAWVDYVATLPANEIEKLADIDGYITYKYGTDDADVLYFSVKDGSFNGKLDGKPTSGAEYTYDTTKNAVVPTTSSGS